MDNLDQAYWEGRYQQQQTGWDAGAPTTPLIEFINGLGDNTLRILIPGCGRAWEGEYLWKNGFRNLLLTDLSPTARAEFLERVPDFPEEQYIIQDFFSLEGPFDLILEQTFFCALDPQLRADYARKMAQLLGPGGTLAGVLFDFPLTEEGPPFGGSKQEYLRYFEPVFDNLQLEPCYNSIKPRAGRELFLLAGKSL